MKRLLFTFVALLSFVISNAQIGYQVALLNTATGEPRSNETVTCEIKLTNSEDAVVYEGKKKATSNDFGVVSLTVGDANTFDQMDWSKLPLYISVYIEGKLVGQTEVLTVPVAECAKTIAPNTNLFGTWSASKKGWHETLILREDGTASLSGSYPDKGESWQYSGNYVNYGDVVFLCTEEENIVLCHINGKLYNMKGDSSSYYFSR